MEQTKQGSMTIDQLLATLDALHEAATAGEWVVYGEKVDYLSDVGTYEVSAPDAQFWVAHTQIDQNANWIVAAHNHYPALREEIRRLKAEAVEHQQSCDLCDACMKRATAYWQWMQERNEARQEIKRLREENAALSQRLREQSAKAGDEVHKMQAELATAKRDGAVEELRRLADEWERLYAPGLADALRDHAAKLEGK